ncbi:hypothetical protein M3P05_05425 [Sansalvadorimonas sp. 2012CJ34-2]|uniref:Uncharacterized protein n=1 Tax=Parendozoicomonas callyspongiae TaxID=2942213 RepID=A0ABT0PDT7_9GAMM|nr:hypothetical protein [Sansalvadorimonas sp. 2012CJ34-2]MCL6269386.1 hypothetical protein [Sansalvadorimonas sp. 2012CJ34-2]
MNTRIGPGVHRGHTGTLSQLPSQGQPRTTSRHYTPTASVIPERQQGHSLSSSLTAGKKLAGSIVFGSEQFHFDKASSKKDKAIAVAGQARTVVGKLQSAALFAQKAAVTGDKIGKGSTSTLNSGAFANSFTALQSLSLVTQTLTFAKTTGTGLYRAVRDIAAQGKRKEAQQLLKEYDAESRTFNGKNDPEKLKKLEHLTDYKGSDLSRNKKQIAVSHLDRIKSLTGNGFSIATSAATIAGQAGASVGRFLPGLSLGANSIATLSSAVKSGKQIIALNNLAKATEQTDDPLLKALSGHIKKERTTHARKHLISTGTSAIAAGVDIGLLASGAGAPAAFIASGIIGTAAGIGTLAFDAIHNRKLAKVREKSQELIASGRPLKSLARENIGVAEKAFLKRLRTGQGQDLSSAVKFLRDFGVTDNTIKKLQLAPEKEAIKKLREVIYTDKVKFKGLMLKQTGKTLLHVSGLSALGKRIKAGSQWLAGKLERAATYVSNKIQQLVPQQQTIYYGYSLMVPPPAGPQSFHIQVQIPETPFQWNFHQFQRMRYTV